MEFREIAQSLGIAEYPPAFDKIYANLSQNNVDICNTQQIAVLQESYNLLDNYYDVVLESVELLKQDPARLCWGKVVATYLVNASLEEARAVPLPVPEGERDPLPLLILLSQAPAAAENFRKRGFSEEVIKNTLRGIRGCIGPVESQPGLVGVNVRFFRWLCFYIKCRIFVFQGFPFEIETFSHHAVYLKNKEDGTLVPLMDGVTLHHSGMILGAAGYEDPEGSRTAVFEETADGYLGCPSVNGKAAGPVTFYPKSQWSIAIRDGDAMLGIHLPKGINMSPENLDSVFSRALPMARQCYPEMNIQGMQCESWLLDPMLADLLGTESKIVMFGNRFSRVPINSNGREVYSFVFPPNTTDLNTLPENTRLFRELKKLYLGGDYIHSFAGVIL